MRVVGWMLGTANVLAGLAWAGLAVSFATFRSMFGDLTDSPASLLCAPAFAAAMSAATLASTLALARVGPRRRTALLAVLLAASVLVGAASVWAQGRQPMRMWM